VTLNAMQVLQVQQAIAAQASAKQKEDELALQAKMPRLRREPRASSGSRRHLWSSQNQRPRRPLTWPLKMTGFREGRERRRGRSAGGSMLNELLKWRVFPTVVMYSRRHLRKWFKPRLLERHVAMHLRMIRDRTNLRILNYVVLYLRSSVDCVRRIRRWNPRRRTIWQRRFARSSVGTMTRDHTHLSNRGGPHGGRPLRVWVVWRAAGRDRRLWEDRQAARVLPRHSRLTLVTTMPWTT
jgi:hypothetical protein